MLVNRFALCGLDTYLCSKCQFCRHSLRPFGPRVWATEPEHRVQTDNQTLFAGTSRDGSDGTRTRDLRRDSSAPWFAARSRRLRWSLVRGFRGPGLRRYSPPVAAARSTSVPERLSAGGIHAAPLRGHRRHANQERNPGAVLRRATQGGGRPGGWPQHHRTVPRTWRRQTVVATRTPKAGSRGRPEAALPAALATGRCCQERRVADLGSRFISRSAAARRRTSEDEPEK